MHTSLRRRHLVRSAGVPLAVAVALTALLAAGCSVTPERDVLARVGDQVITTEEFRATAKDMASQFPFPPDSAKKVLLGEMVKRQLLIAEGIRLGYAKDTSNAAAERKAEEVRITRALFERMVPRDVGVSEAEVVEMHRWRGRQAHMFLLFAPSRAIADAAMAGLKAHRTFAEVSERYGAKGVVPPGGDLGWVAAGQLVDPLDGVSRTAPIGVPQGPLAAPATGWFIALVTERREQPVGALDSDRSLLSDMLRQRKQRAGAMAAFTQLRDQYQVRTEPRGAQVLYAILTSPGGHPGDIAPEEPLASYDGGPGFRGVYRVSDVLRDLADPQAAAPQTSSTEALENWLEGQIVQHVAILEAQRRHLGDEPALARARRLEREDDILQRVYMETIAKDVSVTEDEVRAFASVALAQAGATGMSAATPEDFAKLPEPLQQNLRQAAMSRKREERLRVVTDELAGRTRPFEVHADRLAGIAWPAPAFPGAPGMTAMPQGHPR
jgi:peptidyl-prolyl cis-trans isomerase C